MSLKYQRISKLLLFLQISVFFYFVFLLSQKIIYLLNFDYYFDLAENENLVLINFFQNNIDFSPVNLIKNGIIPIYPDFYHKVISLFSGNILFNARLFNIIISLIPIHEFFKTSS